MDELGRYPENFMLISQLEVCQEEGSREGGYLEDVDGTDHRLGGKYHL